MGEAKPKVRINDIQFHVIITSLMKWCMILALNAWGKGNWSMRAGALDLASGEPQPV